MIPLFLDFTLLVGFCSIGCDVRPIYHGDVFDRARGKVDALNKNDPFVAIYESNDTLMLQKVTEFFREKNVETIQTGGGLTGAQLGMGEIGIEKKIKVRLSDHEKYKKILDDYLMGTGIPEEDLAKFAQSFDLEEKVPYRTLYFAPRNYILNIKDVQIRYFDPISVGKLFAGFVLLLFLVQYTLTLFGSGLEGVMKITNILVVIPAFFLGFLYAVFYNITSRFLGGIKVQTYDAEQLLEKKYERGECYFLDEDGQVQGPFTIGSIGKKVSTKELQKETLLQVEDKILLVKDFSRL